MIRILRLTDSENLVRAKGNSFELKLPVCRSLLHVITDVV